MSGLTAQQRSGPVRIFISYVPSDRELLRELEKRLTPLIRSGEIELWHDQLILPGEKKQEVTQRALERAQLILPLISSDYLASDEHDAQLRSALERHRAGHARIIPILLKPADLSGPLETMQVLPRGDKPLTTWGSRDAAWMDIVKGVRGALSPEPALPAQPRAPRPSQVPPERPESRVLHLSDLHFGTKDQAALWYTQLALDLREQGCEALDAVILSGDITNRSAAGEYAAARVFLEKLLQGYRLSPDRLVLVPGNHDLSWEQSKKAYASARRKARPAKSDLDLFIAPPLTGLLTSGLLSLLPMTPARPARRRTLNPGKHAAQPEEKAYRLRFKSFSKFYQEIKGTPYPLDYSEQGLLHHFPDPKLLVLGLNSAWQLDHIHTKRPSIHMLALSHALDTLRSTPEYEDALKIAVWHHPISGSGEDRILDTGFLELLAQAGFRLALHGHIHTAKNELFRHDMSPAGRRLDVLSAGTFGAPVHEWVPGYPLGYNLLRIGAGRVIVETRRREQLNGAWKPDARWGQGAGRDPLPRYELAL